MGIDNAYKPQALNNWRKQGKGHCRAIDRSAPAGRVELVVIRLETAVSGAYTARYRERNERDGCFVPVTPRYTRTYTQRQRDRDTAETPAVSDGWRCCLSPSPPPPSDWGGGVEGGRGVDKGDRNVRQVVCALPVSRRAVLTSHSAPVAATAATAQPAARPRQGRGQPRSPPRSPPRR